ncbi:MAG: hypothetical protein QOK42_2073, partial [Frankiaceae bacterium]|nr:hypothetical protein [Frankiaceae bacterium]
MTAGIAVVVVLLFAAGVAEAAWVLTGAGSGSAKATTMVAPAASSSSQTNTSITLRVDSQPAGGPAPLAWRVDRTSTTAPGAITNACVILAVGGTCTDGGLTSGTSYTYVVHSARNNWLSPT